MVITEQEAKTLMALKEHLLPTPAALLACGIA